jgi:hypothetical protein
LWALRVLRGVEEKPDPDFIRRNYYKCILAMGDGLLIAHQRFATPYRGRDDRLTQLEKDNSTVAAFQLGNLYKEALQFKFSPDALPDTKISEVQLKDLAGLWGQIFLHIERIRTKRNWPSLMAYSRWDGLREAEQHTLKKLPRNIIRNKQLGLYSWKYPREKLYRQLPGLLGLTETKARDWRTESEHFLKVWDRFN